MLCPCGRISRIFIYAIFFVTSIQFVARAFRKNLFNRSSGVQIPRDICTRFGRYLYSTKCSWIINSIVIPPNSNTFSDWRRTCHVPLVKTQWRPRADKTQWRPRATTPWPWTFHLHVIRSCTLKPRQIFEPAIEVAQRFSLEKPAFIIQEKGFITAKIYQINKGENLNILCLQAFNLMPKNGPPAFGNSLFDHCRQVGK